MHVLSHITIQANTDEVLDTLKKNREQHATIVEEARAGYLDKAQKALEKRMGQLREGKLVQLHFSLQVPTDHSKTYDTAIRALELHKASGAETIELTGDQVRNLIEDDWDWTDRFLLSNAGYSATSAVLAQSKGLM